MKRKQIYLDEEQERAIKQIARDRGVPEAVVIREAMTAYLAEDRAEYDAAAVPGNTGEEPILSVVGILDYPDGPRDGSRTYKRDLYDQPGGPL